MFLRRIVMKRSVTLLLLFGALVFAMVAGCQNASWDQADSQIITSQEKDDQAQPQYLSDDPWYITD
jgi:heme A synthase